jgi:hypothetical protein
MSNIQIEREYRKTMEIWDKESREQDKIFCHTCARNDWVKGVLADNWTVYAESLKLINSSDIRDVKDQTKILGSMEDYKCPRGHGISKEVIRKPDVKK